MKRANGIREKEKAARERRVFAAIAELARLQVKTGSIESRRPPEPDIVCEIEGEGPVAFELVELVDQGLAESESLASHGKTEGGGVLVGDPTLSRIAKKLEGTYATEHPAELVAWAYRLTTPPSVWHPTFGAALRALRLNQFRRLWVVNFGVRDGEAGVWFVDPPP